METMRQEAALDRSRATSTGGERPGQEGVGSQGTMMAYVDFMLQQVVGGAVQNMTCMARRLPAEKDISHCCT